MASTTDNTPEQKGYTAGYSEAVLRNHKSRTVDKDAAHLLPHLKPADKILDAGCGPGTITVGFARVATQGSVVGIDLSDSVIASAQQLVDDVLADPNRPAGEIQLQTGNVLTGLPFGDESFDVVYSSQMFPHLTNPGEPDRAMAELRRVLKKGGIMATRDCADIHFYPRHYGLDRLWAANMAKAICHGAEDADFIGGAMPGVYRKAGFAVDEILVAANPSVNVGTERKGWLGTLERFEDKEYEAGWLRAGVSKEEIEETKAALRRWMEDDDAWYVSLNCDIVAWK